MQRPDDPAAPNPTESNQAGSREPRLPDWQHLGSRGSRPGLVPGPARYEAPAGRARHYPRPRSASVACPIPCPLVQPPAEAICALRAERLLIEISIAQIRVVRIGHMFSLSPVRLYRQFRRKSRRRVSLQRTSDKDVAERQGMSRSLNQAVFHSNGRRLGAVGGFQLGENGTQMKTSC